MYFLKHKSDAASAFRSFLASVRADGKPSLVEIVRSDNGGVFFRGEFESLCNELLIKQEFTPAYSPSKMVLQSEAWALLRRLQWRLVFRLKCCLTTYSCRRLTNFGQRPCTGLAKRLITLLVLLILTPNRRMICGLVKLFLLDHIPSSSQRIVGGSDRRKCCRRVKNVFT